MISGDECGGAPARLGACSLGAYTLSTEAMTAAELMFYCGAPFAHVVRYEHELRAERDRRMRYFRTMPSRRARLEAPLAALAQSIGLVYSTIADVTFFGRDQAGNELSVTGSIGVQFGNFADPE